MNTISRWANFSIILGVIYMSVMVLGILQTWVNGSPIECYWSSLSMLDRVPAMPFFNRMLGLLVDSVGLGIAAYCFYYFARLMVALRSGIFFSETTIILLHALSRGALWWAIYNF